MILFSKQIVFIWHAYFAFNSILALSRFVLIPYKKKRFVLIGSVLDTLHEKLCDHCGLTEMITRRFVTNVVVGFVDEKLRYQCQAELWLLLTLSSERRARLLGMESSGTEMLSQERHSDLGFTCKKKMSE